MFKVWSPNRVGRCLPVWMEVQVQSQTQELDITDVRQVTVKSATDFVLRLSVQNLSCLIDIRGRDEAAANQTGGEDNVTA